MILSCKANKETMNKEGPLEWYKAEVSHLYDYKDGDYVVGVARMARAFYLFKNDKNYAQILAKLKDSYEKQRVIEIGIELHPGLKDKVVIAK